MRVRPEEVFNISLMLSDGTVQPDGTWGMRVDYWDEITDSYTPGSSLFFYEGGSGAPVRRILSSLLR